MCLICAEYEALNMLRIIMCIWSSPVVNSEWMLLEFGFVLLELGPWDAVRTVHLSIISNSLWLLFIERFFPVFDIFTLYGAIFIS